jgi:pantetheine-phosphate adenylyltransferase
MKRTAVYAGSFDPPTFGHLSIIRRAADIFEKVVVLVAVNPAKDQTFSPDERVLMLTDWALDCGLTNVTVDYTAGYVYEHCAKDCVLVRGLRDLADLTDEQAIAFFNREHGVDTVWLPADPLLSQVSSSSLKAYVETGSSRASTYAPDWIIGRLRTKLGR